MQTCFVMPMALAFVQVLLMSFSPLRCGGKLADLVEIWNLWTYLPKLWPWEGFDRKSEESNWSWRCRRRDVTLSTHHVPTHATNVARRSIDCSHAPNVTVSQPSHKSHEAHDLLLRRLVTHPSSKIFLWSLQRRRPRLGITSHGGRWHVREIFGYIR